MFPLRTMGGPSFLKSGSNMEQLNKVELKGVVGNANTQPIGDSYITRFSVATNHAYKDKSGMPVIETTWHQVISFDKNAGNLQRGDKVYVAGRLRNQRYMDESGNERTTVEILSNKVEKLN